MKSVQQVFQESDSGVVIHARESHLVIKIVFGLLFVLALLGICIVPVLLFTNDFGLYMDLAIGAGAVVLCFTAWYFLRLVLWNTYGKEFIMFSKDRVTYTADYRWFQESKQEIPLDAQTSMSVVDHKDGSVYLRLSHNEEHIETVVLVPRGQFKNFAWEHVAHLKPHNLRPIALD
jgi:hypothetical protein